MAAGYKNQVLWILSCLLFQEIEKGMRFPSGLLLHPSCLLQNLMRTLLLNQRLALIMFWGTGPSVCYLLEFLTWGRQLIFKELFSNVTAMSFGLVKSLYLLAKYPVFNQCSQLVRVYMTLSFSLIESCWKHCRRTT